MKEFSVVTKRHSEFVDITGQIQKIVGGSGLQEGVVVVFVPHTTAGLTINENADPDVVADMLYALDKAVAWQDPHYRHGEGNSAAHVKSSLLGHSAHVLVRDGKLQLGQWQGIYFCEFDGPRSRQVWVAIQPAAISTPPN